MAKRLMVLLGMLALALAMAVPALAESAPELTGVIEKPEATTYMYGTHSIVDELGNFYALESEVVDLDAYVGQRVTLSGAFVPGYENGQIEGGPPLFDVTHVEPAVPGGPPPHPTPGSNATIAFELAVECEPPANAEFLGFTSFESIVTAPLTDPDGDGLYTGSLIVPKFPPGPVPPGTEPVSLPFRIVQGPPTAVTALGPEYRVIKDFGSVTAEDTTLSASVSFCDGAGGGGESNGGVVSGDTNNANKGGDVSVDANGSGSEQSSGTSAKVLPATGGILPVAGAAGALLLVGGLVARRIFS